jgi:hypothetical protein
MNNQQTNKTPARQANQPHQNNAAKSLRPIGIIFLVFAAIVTIVFLTQKKVKINWIEDYQTGIELAKKQNKPLLLVFDKKFTRMSTDMWNNTYNRPEVKEYIETNFVPVLIDVDKQPEIAKLNTFDSFPAHYIKDPDSELMFGPRVGYDPPDLFISELKKLHKKLQNSKK